MKSKADVVLIVREIIADVLAQPLEVVVPSARFFADLDGESIDLLDMQFRVEKQLGAIINFKSLLADERLATGERGVLAPGAIEFLAGEFPFLNVRDLPPNPTHDSLRDLLTVHAICEYVWQRMPAVDGTAPSARLAGAPAA